MRLGGRGSRGEHVDEGADAVGGGNRLDTIVRLRKEGEHRNGELLRLDRGAPTATKLRHEPRDGARLVDRNAILRVVREP